MDGENNEIYRRRKCPVCGRLVRTVEKLDDGSVAFSDGYRFASEKKGFKRIFK
jgi:transcriptional regulator NrdR family protein